MDNETRSLPMVALRGLTIMPEMIVHFDVSRERSIAAIQQAMVEEQEIFLVAQKSIETENPGQDDVYETGTVASVKQLIKLSKKVVRVLVEGKNRAVLKKIEETDPYLLADICCFCLHFPFFLLILFELYFFRLLLHQIV